MDDKGLSKLAECILWLVIGMILIYVVMVAT
jgi:hypothetical protein